MQMEHSEYIKLKDETELTFKLYRKGTETPIHEFDSTTTGKSLKIGWHGAGVYTLVVTDQAKNETSKEFEVYHDLNSVNALEKALLSGHLSGAAVDVLKQEPMNNESSLEKIDNLIITPHTAWAPLETRKRLIKLVYQSLSDFLNGKEVNNLAK